MKKRYSIQIRTPREGHYIELGSLYPLELDKKAKTYARFSEIRVIRPGRTLRWLVDDWVDPDLINPGFGMQYSVVVPMGTATTSERLDKNGFLEFKVHLTSPVIPRTKGLWLRLDVAFTEDDGLIFKKECDAQGWDGVEWKWADTAMPDWLHDRQPAQWVIERGKDKLGFPYHRSLSVGSRLLCARWDDSASLRGNLVHIDDRAVNNGKDDFRFSLLPVETGLPGERGNVWDVRTELTVAPDFASPVLVSNYALLLADSMRSSVPFTAHGLHLRCELQEDTEGRPRGWALDWLEVPGQPAGGPRHRFTLESLSEAHLLAHAYGLATTRARNRLSVVPTWVSTVDGRDVCYLSFELKREAFDVSDVRLRSVRFGKKQVPLVFTCGGAIGLDGIKSWQVFVTASDYNGQPPEQPLFIHWNLESLGGHTNAWQLGAGSVLLTLDGFKAGEFSLSCTNASPQGGSPTDGPYRRIPLEANLRLDFGQAHYAPLSMDPEIGFETLSAVVMRPRPWTFDLDPVGVCSATITESASHEQSRLLRVELSAPGKTTISTDVLVVDPCPFTIVRVRGKEQADGRDIVAEYIDDADQAPEWRFYTQLGQMTAVLPPQGIGEEMVKGFLFLHEAGGKKTPVPLPGKLFDFRLTPVARLLLDRTDIDIARTEAPWSLRRLLSQRPGVTGMRLERARFELLYGLQAQVGSSGLRIAELDGLVGRVPYPDALRRALERWHLRHAQDPILPGHDTPEEQYAAEVSSWQAGLWNRPSWWRVFRDASQRSRLLLQDGVQYMLRPSRQTAKPFEIGEYADDDSGKADQVWNRKPLRGGVDWPFQSRNIYAALKHTPVSSSGSVEGLAFGTLGGEGTQTAAFNNGKTLIISSSRQGRLDSVTLIRVGRISKIWNRARHVIVYERTTRRAPRYDPVGAKDPGDDDLEVQPDLKGMAALRKVREYIEISEAKRHFPDSDTDRPVAGPLLQSVFGTTVIPVMSSWGHDVPGGFVMSLRGPIPAGKEKFFPDPHVFLGFARPEDKGSGVVSQRVTSTGRLVFFSSTRNQDGGDTDQWPAWPDIDFPLIRPISVPDLPFHGSFAGLRQPDAQSAEFGMDPFTLLLAPAEEGANLMHGRQVPGLEAKISNINLARGLPDLPVLSGDAAKGQQAAQSFGSKRAILLDSLRDLRAGIRHLATGDSNASISGNPQLQKDLTDLLARITLNVYPSDDTVPALNLGTLQTDRDKAYVKGVEDTAASLSVTLNELANRAAQAKPEELEVVLREAMALADAVNIEAKERLGNLAVVRVQALEEGRSFIGELTARLVSQFQMGASQISQMMAVLKSQVASQPQRLREFEDAWRESVAQLPSGLRGMLETLGPAMDAALGRWFSPRSVVSPPGGEATLRARVLGTIGLVVSELADYLDRWLAALPPFELDQPDFDVLQQELADLFDPQLAEGLLSALAAEFATMLGKLGAWDAELQSMRDQLDTAVRTLQAQLLAAADPEGIAKNLVAYATELGTSLDDAAGKIVKSLAVPPDIEAEMARLQGSFDALKDYGTVVGDAVAAISANLQGTVGKLEGVVESEVAAAEIAVAAASRQLEEWARAKIAGAVDIGKSNVNAALETVRILAEGPVTEGLQVTRDQVGYYFDKTRDAIALTPTCAMFNDLGQNVLNALSASIPFRDIYDRLLPAIGGLSVRDLFPDFCGIKLTYLLPDLDVPLDDTHEFDWLTIQHGFDRQRLSAWARVSINKRFDDDATLFDLGPIKLKLLKPLFYAVADLVVEDGRQRHVTSGRLEADFELSLNGKPMVTLVDGVLAFDERGKLDFQFDSNRLVLANELNFIQQALQALMPQVNGLVLTPLLPAGIQADLTLPLPDIGTGAFTLTGITLNSQLGLLISDGFEIRTGLWLSKPQRPFGLAILFLGGGGWFGIEASFKPPSRFVSRVSIGISAGAFVAVNFGFAAGSAGLLFTAGVDFYRDWQKGNGSTAVSLGLVVWGEFSILGVASAGVRLTLQIMYKDDGSMRGDGLLSASIRICWCYTLQVSRPVTKQFAGSSSQHSSVAASALLMKARAVAGPIGTYAMLPATDIADAVSRYFETLAI